jgi:alpha-1,2-mannosyltransferase
VSTSALAALGLFVLVAHSDPVRVGMSLGQINVFIALLVLADFSGVLPRLPRGCLIGLATALKLTPAFLIVYLLVVRRYRAAAVAASTFLVVSLTAFAFAPSTSWQYWFHGYFANARRTGDVEYISNQSLNGLLVRLMGAPDRARPLWLVSAALTAVFILWLARRAHAERPWLGEALALSGMLLISPVTWVHHWIIVLPLLLASWRCAAEATARVRVALLSTTVALSGVMLFGVVWWGRVTNDQVTHAAPAQYLVGNSQVLLLLALVASVAVFVHRAPHARQLSSSVYAESSQPS